MFTTIDEQHQILSWWWSSQFARPFSIFPPQLNGDLSLSFSVSLSSRWPGLPLSLTPRMQASFSSLPTHPPTESLRCPGDASQQLRHTTLLQRMPRGGESWWSCFSASAPLPLCLSASLPLCLSVLMITLTRRGRGPSDNAKCFIIAPGECPEGSSLCLLGRSAVDLSHRVR